jgi:hypothetical protein
MFLAGMLLLPSGVAAFAWYGALACAVCFIWAMTRANAWRCFIGGWFAATALMFRPDIGPAVILAALVLVWPLTRPQQAKFGLGVAIGLIPLAVMSCLTGPEQLFNNLFLYPVIRSAPARRIPLLTAEPTLVRLFFAQVVSAMVNIVAGVLAVRARPSGRRERALLALALLGAGIIPQAWQRLDLTHLFFVVFLIVGTLPLSIYFLLARRSEGRRRPWLVLASTATVAIFVTGLAPSLPTSDFRLFGEALRTSLAGSVSVQRGPRSFPIGSPQQVVEIGRLLDTLERLSQPGQRLFVGPADLRRTNYCDTFIYHLLPNLRPATYFLEMNPLSANRPGSRLAADILSADWLVLNRKWDLVVEPNKSAEDGSAEAAEVVPAHFHFVAQFGTFALFQRNR